MMLAETFAKDFNWTLVFTGAMAIATVLMWWDARKSKGTVIEGQPLTVKVIEALHEKFASKVEFDRQVAENKREHENIFSKIGGVDRGAASKISGEVNQIHQRINSIEKSVGSLETATEMQNQRLVQMDSKIDRLIERV